MKTKHYRVKEGPLKDCVYWIKELSEFAHLVGDYEYCFDVSMYFINKYCEPIPTPFFKVGDLLRWEWKDTESKPYKVEYFTHDGDSFCIYTDSEMIWGNNGEIGNYELYPINNSIGCIPSESLDKIRPRYCLPKKEINMTYVQCGYCGTHYDWYDRSGHDCAHEVKVRYEDFEEICNERDRLRTMVNSLLKDIRIWKKRCVNLEKGESSS